MSVKVIVGIDTSNYTTSCAVCSLDGVVLENYKQLLPVKEGENGLRQSDAVFAHVKNFQIISSRIKEKHANYEIVAIGCSAYPRDAQGSYMPCFLVGKAVCDMISALYCIPAYEFSHQSGHIQAAMYSAGIDLNERFVAFHVSGGTTDIVLVNPNGVATFDITQIGGSVDLHAGQAIDRIGVKMGLQFPCGKEIERLALKYVGKIPPAKVCVKGLDCNLSGLENLSLKLLNDGGDKTLVSAFVLSFISKTLEKLTDNIRNEHGEIKIIFAGGVMSNKIIQNNIAKKFDNVFFSEPAFSADNAAGVALLARKKYLEK
jgi:N6-L-threonylcarbamoyladenine synthase